MIIKINKSPSADSRTTDVTKVTKDKLFESSKEHISDVGQAVQFFIDMLFKAAINHDYTKIDDPEEKGLTSFYNSFSKGLTGDAFKAEPWFRRHIIEERHHLNDHCPDDVTLIDVLERVADITTAGMARSGSIYDDTLDPDILVKAYKNTINLLQRSILVIE